MGIGDRNPYFCVWSTAYRKRIGGSRNHSGSEVPTSATVRIGLRLH